MTAIKEIVNDKLLDARNLFNGNELFKYIKISNIDCSELPHSSTDGNKLPDKLIENLFSHLHFYDEEEVKINECPVVYVFELHDKNDRDRIISAFKEVQKTGIDRTLPALKKQIPNSKYLYVGKVEKEIGGRIVTHLGYYQKSGNHGLQLAFWARNMNPEIRLNLHVFRFKKEFKPFIAAMEVIIAKELEPIIGKH